MSDLISRCELFNRLAPVQTLGEAYGIIQEMPTVDAVPVVRCKDCRWHDDQNGATEWMPCREMKMPNDYYCASGKRKDGNHEAD